MKALKKYLYIIPFLFQYIAAFPQAATLEDFVSGDRFKEKELGDLISSQKGNYFFREADNRIVAVSFENGANIDTLVDYINDSIANFGSPVGFRISPDENKVLFFFNQTGLYRYSFLAQYIVFDRKRKDITLVADTAMVRDADFSSDGNYISFVRDNNLFLQQFSNGKIRQLTTDGKETFLINGAPDWVYEEEFTLKKAYQWSPDGKAIAFLKFDESLVPEYTLTFYDDNNYPVQKKYKYPKAGENNSIVELWFCDVNTGKLKKINTGNENDAYIPRFCWTNQSGKLAFVKMNRLQNHLEINIADIATGKSENVYSETAKKYIDELPEEYPLFINAENDFLITSEINGFNHIYLKKSNQKTVLPVTSGNFEVTELLAYDEKNALVYFKSHEKSPLFTNLFKIPLTGGKAEIIGNQTGQCNAFFNKNFSDYIFQYNNSKQPNTEILFHANISKSDTLINNKELAKDIQDLKVPLKDFFTIQTTEGTILNAWMLKPSDFDPSKKYPVLLFVYGGPGVQTVIDSWKINWLNYLAMQGYIVVSADNRGTIGRGQDFRSITYGNLGLKEAADQIEVAKYMAKQKYTDASRIGIYGWSYGGYLSAMCLLQGSEVFKAGISVAPPVHWKFYDSVYAERYMGLPSGNPTGYESSSLLSYTPLLKSNFLLIHGMTDDNVHIQNSMVLIDALVRDNKTFDFFAYPNKNHAITGGNTRLHLYTKMQNFLKEKL